VIEIKKISKEKPYKKFLEYYEKALDNNQSMIYAINVSSYDIDSKEVESRMVNLKYIIDNEWTFFSNYQSPKALQFQKHDQISVIFYWDSIDVQIRVKAKVGKSNDNLSDEHFKSRANEKNALAISSMQSSKINSYKNVVDNYNEILAKNDQVSKRPNYWGGFSFVPYYFEFWEGHKNRINKRNVYSLEKDIWKNYYLQP
tara:strand:- start:860 stop:1459 length:600 start_codon:yes stop_codon:yes gene_type:complete